MNDIQLLDMPVHRISLPANGSRVKMSRDLVMACVEAHRARERHTEEDFRYSQERVGYHATHILGRLAERAQVNLGVLSDLLFAYPLVLGDKAPNFVETAENWLKAYDAAHEADRRAQHLESRGKPNGSTIPLSNLSPRYAPLEELFS